MAGIPLVSVPLSCDYSTSASGGRIIDHRPRFPIRSLCHRRENTIGSYVICGAPIARLAGEVNAMATLSSSNKNGVPRDPRMQEPSFLSNCFERWTAGASDEEGGRFEEDAGGRRITSRRRSQGDKPKAGSRPASQTRTTWNLRDLKCA